MELQGKLGFIFFFTTFTNPFFFFFLTSYVSSVTLNELNRVFFKTGRIDTVIQYSSSSTIDQFFNSLWVWISSPNKEL